MREKSSGGVAHRVHVGNRMVVLGMTYLLSSMIVSLVQGNPSQTPALNLMLDGPIEDAKCNIEDLEEANDSQLYSILQELSLRTEFFANFVVDLDSPCPLSGRKNQIAHGEEKPEDHDETDDEEFDCGGSDEQDEDDEPLCTVDTSSDDDAAGLGFMSGSSMFTSSPLMNPTSASNALHSLSQEGFASPDQQQAFAWNEQTDIVVMEPDATEAAACADDDLPDTFWIDMCSNISEEHTKVVDLALNPEHNTGYNGTHLWNAIYQEHCGYRDGQCLEDRVLYRLLSGLHTSTTLSIAKHYYPPSKRKNRTDWEPNPEYFMEKLGSSTFGGEYIRNLHFSYVVLLRALKKATPLLKNYEIRTGNIVKDEAATVLLRRLLDSSILTSCSSVFEAFDESLMFQEDNSTMVKQNFKGVFQNISSILDCVQCQQCKLHGKMAMMGYGTALKILFMKQVDTLERNEIVALIQTLAKLSRSIREVRELTQLFYSTSQTISMPPDLSATSWDSWNIVDQTVGLISQLSESSKVNPQQEGILIQLALQQHPPLLILAKHYGHSLNQFGHHLDQANYFANSATATAMLTLAQQQNDLPPYDAVVIGSGLAGLAASWHILNRGGRVLLLEKEHLLGGNSNKASSGINAYVPDNSDGNVTESLTESDSLDLFIQDTIKSAGPAARPDLVHKLVSNSGEAVRFLRDEIGVDLSLKAQLGGHSSRRTHRPSNGMAGAEIIYGLQKAVRSFEKTGQATIWVDTRVTQILTNDDGTKVIGVEYQKLTDDSEPEKIFVPHVILATGGFASDRRPDESYLSQYRPDLLSFPTTAGDFSTGDGIAMATALGAGTTLMDKVQIHPTGWVNPSDPENTSKVLAAELLRGVGGILINQDGRRFCNEVGTRAYVADKMLAQGSSHYAKTKEWDPSKEQHIPTFSLVLTEESASMAKKHVDLYSHKGLMTRVEGGLEGLAQHIGVSKRTLASTWVGYQTAAEKGKDQFGKTRFPGLTKPPSSYPKSINTFWDKDQVFYVGTVTPVLHYCMGGVTIDLEGNVLDVHNNTIEGLHAAGEVTGGVHGNNRLGGNSLLECTVFGTIVGKGIPIQPREQKTSASSSTQQAASKRKLSDVSMSLLEEHNNPESCWVAVHGMVYDFTDFAEEHPAGAESIHDLCGQDGSEAFGAVHNDRILEDFEEDRIGRLKI